jgi:hypothetical protein
MVVNVGIISGNYLGWYSTPVIFSNWKDAQCDYATNKYVHDYYNKDKAEYYRSNYFTTYMPIKIKGSKHTLLLPDSVFNKIKRGDTVRIGSDYYGLFGDNIRILPFILTQNIKEDIEFINKIKQGDVVIYSVNMVNDNIYFKRTK